MCSFVYAKTDSLNIVYTYRFNGLYLEKENVIRYKFMLLPRVFSSMQINKKSLSLSLRLVTFFACS